MEAKNKRIVFVAIFCLSFFCAGFSRGCLSERTRGVDNQVGAKRHEAISNNAQRVAENAEKSIAGSLESVRDARSEVTESIAGVGEIRITFGTITGELESSEPVVSRIEDGIRILEQILQEAENRAGYLARSGEP